LILLLMDSNSHIRATIGMCVIFRRVTRSLRSPSEETHSLRGLMRIRGMRFCAEVNGGFYK
jgi:hypothetical protein